MKTRVSDRARGTWLEPYEGYEVKIIKKGRTISDIDLIGMREKAPNNLLDFNVD